MERILPLRQLQRFYAGKITGSLATRIFDHLIRSTESYVQKWDYVRENPVRAGLVSRREDWPFQGEIVEIGHAFNGSAPSDGGSYNACGGCITLVEG